MKTTDMLLCDWTPQETITLNHAALRSAAAGFQHWIDPLWPELVERARTPRGKRPPWPTVAARTVEEQYIVSLALDCAAWARVEVVRAVIHRHVVEILLVPEGSGPREFRPDVGVRLALVAKAADADAKITANERTN
jgi:hypothetical protein